MGETVSLKVEVYAYTPTTAREHSTSTMADAVNAPNRILIIVKSPIEGFVLEIQGRRTDRDEIQCEVYNGVQIDKEIDTNLGLFSS